MTPSSHRGRVVKIATVAGFVISLVFAWLWWVLLFDLKLQRPSDRIERFLVAAQNRDYAEAKSFFSSHQLKNIAAWQGSFENWCDQFAEHRNWKVGRTGIGKSGHYRTDVSAKNPDGSIQSTDTIYAKRFNGVWSLEYGLSHESLLSLHGGDPESEKQEGATNGQAEAPAIEDTNPRDGVYVAHGGIWNIVLELRDGRYRFWSESDAKDPSAPKHPIEGRYTIDGSTVHFDGSATIRSMRFRRIGDIVTLWHPDQTDLKPFEHPLVNGGRPQLFEGGIEHFRKYGTNGILVVSAKPAEEAWNTRSAPILEP